MTIRSTQDAQYSVGRIHARPAVRPSVRRILQEVTIVDHRLACADAALKQDSPEPRTDAQVESVPVLVRIAVFRGVRAQRGNLTQVRRVEIEQSADRVAATARQE